LIVTRSQAAACAGARARVRGVWDPERQSAVEHAFLATGLPYAKDAFAHVRDRLSDYTARWSAMSESSCRATRVEGRQSDTLLDLRSQCLDRRLATLAALVDAWRGTVTPDAVAHAAEAAASLAPLDDCADVPALTGRAPPPQDPQVRAR